MLAPRPTVSSTALPAPESAPGPVSAPEVRAPLRPATDDDATAGSPVHALQARLADEIAPPRQRRDFDPAWLLIAAGNAACWWGLISLGALLARHWPFR